MCKKDNLCCGCFLVTFPELISKPNSCMWFELFYIIFGRGIDKDRQEVVFKSTLTFSIMYLSPLISKSCAGHNSHYV